MVAHVTRVFPPLQLCAIFARPIALFAIQHGRPERPAVATAGRCLSLTALVPVALHAAYLHVPAAPRTAEQRTLPRVPPGLQHVAASTEPATNTSARRTATAAATAINAAAHGFTASTTATRNAAILPSSCAFAARPADEHGQHGPGAVQRDAIPATATRRRPASIVRRPPQEGD